MKYKSELIKDIVDTRGHEKSSLHYESECVGTWIEEAKGGYPKLCDYESEWLNYIALNPVGEFPYVNLSDVTEATVDNVVPYAYKSAILKGKSETIDGTLQSVKMPILTTTGKNLFNKNKLIVDGYIISNGTLVYQTGDNRNATDFIEVKAKTIYTISGIKNSAINGGKTHQYIGMYDKNKTFISVATVSCTNDKVSITTAENTKYIRLTVRNADINRLQIEKGTAATTYEPHKSNILTVNEYLTLRSSEEVYDELNLLTGQLTQRIDEDGTVLSQNVIKTVELTVVNQDGETLTRIKPIEGTMHLSTSSETINPLFSGEIPVEAITQN